MGAVYLRHHRALMADIAGRKASTRIAYERMFRQDSRTLRTSLAYSQHAAHYGDIKLAKQVLKDQLPSRTQGEPHPLAKDLYARLDGKRKFRC